MNCPPNRRAAYIEKLRLDWLVWRAKVAMEPNLRYRTWCEAARKKLLKEIRRRV